MAQDGISRRQWLVALWPQIAAAQEHAHRAVRSGTPAALTVLDSGMAAEIEAIAAQIIPSDGTPGAREAGVIYFIDRALTTFAKDKRDAYRTGLQETQAKRAEMFPGSKSIAGLAAEQQIALLQAIEKTAFFELVRMHTIMGFLGSPSHGGNRDLAGWKVIGFEDKHSFEPPFGYYDARASEGEKR